jgi:AcrR family transcriptional regulator
MSIPLRSLASRHTDLTQRVILDAALELLEQASVHELSARAVAKHAGISERTIFRYFANRDDFLAAVAAATSDRLQVPVEPTSLEELLAFPQTIYTCFEDKIALTKAALHSELYDHIREADGERRGAAVRSLVDLLAPGMTEQERKLATANIRYYLVATTWHYYRFYFELSLEESIQCARMAIVQTLLGIGVKDPALGG